MWRPVRPRRKVPGRIGPEHKHPDRIFVVANVAYVAGQKDGVFIADVADPTRPYKLAENDEGRYVPHSIVFDGGYIYTADAKKGLVVLEYAPHPKDQDGGQ